VLGSDQTFLDRLKVKLAGRAAAKHVRESFKHVCGPSLTKLADDEVALVLLGRDVGYFLDYHIRYHLALGVSHIVYVDNGSSDASVEIASRFPNVTVAICSANFRIHQGRMRHYANTCFLSGGWRLAIDPDELFDYPQSDRIDLPELTRRMASRGHTALVGQMLDMVRSGSLVELPGDGFEQAIKQFNRYSLENITAEPYHGSSIPWHWYLDQNEISSPDIEVLFGGVRRAAFGENCCLTKHPLFRMQKGVTPQPHPHVTTGVKCTDFSAVLKHYKFAGGILDRERKLLNENRISHREMRLRVEKLDSEPDLDLNQFAPCQDATVSKLLDQGFLKASDAALEMLS